MTDYAKWFPRNDNLKTGILRYTEGNTVMPLIHGKEAFRAMYRAWRSTYISETYRDENDMPDGVPRVVDGPKRPQIFLTNLRIGLDNPLLGMRSLLSTPRTQGETKVDNPFAKITFIPAASPASREEVVDQAVWWIVGMKGSLPPGAHIQYVPIDISKDFFGHDPRIGGNVVSTDLYGITIRCQKEGEDLRLISVFANKDGSFFLPVNYGDGWGRMATVRVVTWEPDKGDAAPFSTDNSGRGTKVVRSLGTIMIPAPPLRRAGPTGTVVTSENVILSNNDAASGAAITIKKDTVKESMNLVIVNERSGDYVETRYRSKSIRSYCDQVAELQLIR